MPRLSSDGADLAYDDVGEGAPPILLIHGLTGGRDDFAHQLTAFGSHHRVVAFDQRGHGESSFAEDGNYTVERSATDAATLCGQLGLGAPVVVGHSFGGVVALKLANRGLASALILLDSTVELPASAREGLGAYADQLDAMSESDYHHTVGQYLQTQTIAPADDGEIAARIVERAARVPRQVYVPAIRSILAEDITAAARAVDVPSMFLSSPLAWMDLARVHELLPTWIVGQTVGSGHFHQVFVPDQVNAMIRRFIEITMDVRCEPTAS